MNRRFQSFFFPILIPRKNWSIVFAGIAIVAAAVHAKSVAISVSSGGVSLGSYQGGYLLGKALQDTDTTAKERRILTGASAGAINTLGGLYYSFHQPGVYDPFSEWLKIDWSRIAMDDSALDEGHLFSTRYIEERLDTLLTNLLKPPETSLQGREVRAGFAITRFLPPKVGDKVQARQTNDKIVVGLRWLEKCPDPTRAEDGCYQAWSEVFDSQAIEMQQPVLWFGSYGTNDTLIRANLKNLALASGAFPVAFAPRKLPLFGLNNKEADTWNSHWINQSNQPLQCASPELPSGTMECIPSSGRRFALGPWRDSVWGRWRGDSSKNSDGSVNWVGDTAKYSDGGMFENQPLEMAFRIRENSTKVDSIASVGMLIPDRYPFDFGRETPISRGMVSEWILFLTQRWPGQTETELERALRRKESDWKKFTVNEVSLPLASEHFFAFSGFFEERFRQFDFLVGFMDAHFSDNKLDKEAVRKSLKRMQVAQAVPILNVFDRPLGEFLVEVVEERDSIWPSLEKRARANVAESGSKTLKALIKRLDRLCPTLPGPDRELAKVIRASLFVQKSSMEGYAKGSPPDAADRYLCFLTGLGERERSQADALYARLVGLFARDAYGFGNSWTYPFLLYHLREGMALGFGGKPLWSAPYLRIESASPGFRVWQGYSVVPRRFISIGHPFWNNLLLPLRAEFGARIVTNDGRWTPYAGSRIGWEVPLSWFACKYLGWFSLVPNWTYESALVGRPDAWGPGVDLRLFDLVNISYEQEQREGATKSVFTAGIQVGFDLLSIAEGTRNGTNKARVEK